MATVQIWHCKKVPKLIPEFVCPHVTYEKKNSYLIEVNINHPGYKSLINQGLNAQTILQTCKIIPIELIAETNSPFLTEDGKWQY